MSKVLTNNQYYSQIANIIREQNGTSNTYKPVQMVNALKDLFYEEVEGVPPLNFQGIGEKLLDYRIYGASGGVGDRTDNLFSSDISDGYHLDSITGLPVPSQTRCATIEPIPINSNNLILTFKSNVVATKFMYSLFSGNTLIRRVANLSSGVTIDTSNADKIYFAFYRTDSSSAVLSVNNLNNIMLSTLNADYEPYGYKIPIVVSGKNLLPPINEWESGYLNTSGTVSSANVDRKEIASPFIKVNPNETYAFSFYPNEGDAWRCAGYYTANKEFVSRKFASTTSDPIIFTIPDNIEFIRLSYRTYGDGTYAQLEQNSEVTTYEPYIEPTTTNIYLDKPIRENESISLSDTNIKISTIRGTNILTVDTTVQPSNVYVKSRKESQYETAMREDYEEQLSDIESALQEV